MDQLAGFREYLTVAEADDLQRIEGISGPRPSLTPERIPLVSLRLMGSSQVAVVMRLK